MPALSSYTPIATSTLTATANSVTFSSIPATYTDLILIYNGASTNSNQNTRIQFNGDTATNYSFTALSGNGTVANSSRGSSVAHINMNEQAGSQTQTTVRLNVMNYANTNTYKTTISRYGTALGGPEAIVGLWRNTAAITSIKFFLNGAETFIVGSTFSLYGIANNTAGAKATGGVISSDTDYFYHSFYATSTFTPSQSLTCDYLVVAGGGGGGRVGGGGGAGGLRSTVTATGGGGSLETALSVTATGYTITVGAGGAGSTSRSAKGTNGSNSVFSTITSDGGGGGGSFNATYMAGANGGSGGGGSWDSNGTPTGGTRTVNQGFNGGTGGTGGSAGGGGAGVIGNNPSSGVGGNGGNGVATSISGSSVTYAGGGGGGGGESGPSQTAAGLGGSGGGGAGSVGTSNATAGTLNTGGGGGGSRDQGAGGGNGGTGGSGVVIIRYAR